MIENLARAVLGSTLGRVHSVPAGERHHVVGLLVCNSDTSARTLTLRHRRATGDADAASLWFSSYRIAANDTRVVPFLTSLAQADELLGLSDAADKVVVHVQGWKGGAA